MKNITTLSLITVAILAVNGCGGENPSSNNEKVTSIQKLSEASTKHTKAEWSALENEIQDLEKTALFNTVLLNNIEKNVANLTYVGIDKEMAYATNSDAMFDDLTKLDLGDFDNQVVQECKEDESCKEMAYDSLDPIFTIDKEMAYVMATDIRGEEHAFVNDQLVNKFTCASGEVKTVQHYGIEDLFSTANGVEPTSQNPIDIKQDMIDYNNNVNAGFATYDGTHINRLFLDDIKNLPAGITKGRLYIGLKSNGSSLQGNDTLSFGDLSSNDRYAKALTDLQGDGWNVDLVNNSNTTTAIYSSDFRDIPLNMHTGSNDTLLTLAQSNQRFGAYVQDDTSVDFITVATCSKPNPIEEIKKVVDNFECSEKETLVKILGGEIDAFSPTADTNPINPSSDLKTRRDVNTAYPNIDVSYDYTAYDHHFIDTLKLNLSSSQIVTKAEFNIGYKVIGSPLASNDVLYVGDFETNHAGGHLYDNISPIIPQGWNVHDFTSNYGYVANVNLFDLNNTLGTGKVSDTMIAKNELDVYVQDDTAVDFTQLNLCVKDNCNENAKDIKLDLSQLASWTEKPNDAVEQNTVPSSWDNSLNWFSFDSNQKEKILKIPFCACGNTIVNIEHLKGDNIARVTLDSTSVAYQPWSTNGVAGYIADTSGGHHVDGSKTILGTGTGVNHVLELNATNLYSSTGNPTPFGVAVKGILTFKGNLGKCTK